jgi:putative transposase
VAELGVPERRACRVLGQYRSTQRKVPTTPEDEAALTADITTLAIQYGRYGCRRKPRPSSKDGGSTTIRCDRIHRWATSHPRQKQSCGRLRSDATSEPGNVISFILFNRPVPGKDQVYPE